MARSRPKRPPNSCAPNVTRGARSCARSESCQNDGGFYLVAFSTANRCPLRRKMLRSANLDIAAASHHNCGIIQSRYGPANMILDRDAEIPMRDGAILRANVYRPAADGQ